MSSLHQGVIRETVLPELTEAALPSLNATYGLVVPLMALATAVAIWAAVRLGEEVSVPE